MGKTKSVVIIVLLLLLEVRGEEVQKDAEDSWLEIVKDSAAAATAATGAVLGGVQLGLSAVGFSAAGPVAGSLAVGFQASIGNVVAGSAFATCQSLAMTGVVTTLGGPAVIIGGGVGAAYFIYRAYRKIRRQGNVPFVPISLMMYGFTPKCTIPDYFEDDYAYIQDQVGSVLKGVQTTSTEGILAIGGAAQKVGSAITDTLESIDWSSVQGKAGDLVGKSQSIAMDGISAIGGTAQTVGNTILSGVESVDWGQVQDKAGSIINTGSSIAIDGIASVGGTAQQVGGFIKSEIESIDWANVRDKAGSVIDSGSSIAKKGAELTGETIEKVGETAKKVYEYSWGTISSVLGI